MWLVRRSGKKVLKEIIGKKGWEKKNVGKKCGEKKCKKKVWEKSVGNGVGRKSIDYIVFDLSFIFDWVKKWCEIFKLIKMCRGLKVILYNFGYFWCLIEYCFNCD